MPTTASIGPGPLPTLSPLAQQNPDVVRQYLTAQRQQQLAAALSQQGLAPIDYDPRGRVSWAQGLAKALQTYEGMKLGQSADAATAQAMAGNYHAIASRFPMDQQSSTQAGSPVGQPPSQSAAGTSSQAPTPSPAALALALGGQQGSVGPTNANATVMDQLQSQQVPNTRANNPTGMAPQLATGPNAPLPDNGLPINATASPPNRQLSASVVPQPPAGGAGYAQPLGASGTPGGGSSLVMPGLTPQQSMTAYMADPAGYMAELVKRSDNRTDFSKTMISAGIDPASPQGQQLLAENLRKQNWITPPAVRPGGGVMDPRTGSITTMPSAAPTGFQNVQRPDGSWAMVSVPGGTAAVTASTAAGEAGKAPYGLIDTFDPVRNAPTKNYAGNVLPLPPVPGAGASAGPGSAGAAGAQQFDIGGSPQERAAIFTNIARNAPDAATRAAALAQLQQIQSGGGFGNSPQTAADPRSSGVQTGPSLGLAQGATNAQNELSANWSAQQQAHSASQTNIGLLQQLKGLADAAITGYEPAHRQYVAQLGAYLGLPGMDSKASASDLLGKYSSQLVAGLSAKGMNTDAARDIVMAGTPNAHMQPSAIKDAVDGLVAREQMTQARTAAVQPFAMTRDANGYQGAATSFDQVADPRLWQMRSMSPQQLQRFTANLSPADAAQLSQKYVAAKQNGYLQ